MPRQPAKITPAVIKQFCESVEIKKKMVIVLQKSKNRKFNKTLAAILIIYTIALICSVCMLVIMPNTRYIFAVIALVGYVVVSVLIIIKLIQFFINKKRKR